MPTNVFTIVPTTDPFTLSARAILPSSVARNTGLWLVGSDQGNFRISGDCLEGATIYSGRRTDGSAASPLPLRDGDAIAILSGGGYNGTMETADRFSVAGRAAGPWSNDSQPTKIVVSVTPVNGHAAIDTGVFDEDGSLQLPVLAASQVYA